MSKSPPQVVNRKTLPTYAAETHTPSSEIGQGIEATDQEPEVLVTTATAYAVEAVPQPATFF